MPDRELRLEALSAILECPVKFHKDSQENKLAEAEQTLLQPQDIISFILGITSREDLLLKATSQLKSLSVSETHTEAGAIRKELFVNEEDFFDPAYDFDFTHIKDTATHERGGERYSRPYGWKRYALRVLDKYEDGNGWLGMGGNAWPVSYHGTSIEGAKGIIQSHYKAGPRQVFGRGIYSTPNVADALIYSKTFTSKSTKKTYEVILQNRINPKNRQRHNDYWLVPVPKGTPTDEEEKISESSIRPYGLLLREVKNTANLCSSSQLEAETRSTR